MKLAIKSLSFNQRQFVNDRIVELDRLVRDVKKAGKSSRRSIKH